MGKQMKLCYEFSISQNADIIIPSSSTHMKEHKKVVFNYILNRIYKIPLTIGERQK